MTNRSSSSYWKMEYERLLSKGTNKPHYNNEYSQVYLKQLEEQTAKQALQIKQYLTYIEQLENTQQHTQDDTEILKYKTLLEQRDNQVIALQMELNTQYKIALQQLEKQDKQMKSMKAQSDQQIQELKDFSVITAHLQKEIANEQQLNKSLKEQVISCELLNEQQLMDAKAQSKIKDELNTQITNLNTMINSINKEVQLVMNQFNQYIQDNSIKITNYDWYNANCAQLSESLTSFIEKIINNEQIETNIKLQKDTEYQQCYIQLQDALKQIQQLQIKTSIKTSNKASINKSSRMNNSKQPKQATQTIEGVIQTDSIINSPYLTEESESSEVDSIKSSTSPSDLLYEYYLKIK